LYLKGRRKGTESRGNGEEAFQRVAAIKSFHFAVS